MMVLNVRNTTGSTITVASGIQIAANSSKVFPADRCIWDTSYTNGQYTVTNAELLLGASTTGNANGVVGLNGTGRIVELGYIGKSGRFVKIAN